MLTVSQPLHTARIIVGTLLDCSIEPVRPRIGKVVGWRGEFVIGSLTVTMNQEKAGHAHRAGEVPEKEPISIDTPDWSRERCQGLWDPSRRLLRSLRQYQKWKKRKAPWRWFSKYWVLHHRFWSVVTGADIPLNCHIGGGLLLTHPNGVVIFPDAVIGPNCLILQQVTIGTGGAKPGAPILGGHVDVGAGAKILGGVKIGDRALIGSNAVVLQDVPRGATAVGIPAKILHVASDHGELVRNSS